MAFMLNSPVGALSIEEHDGAVVKLDWHDDGTLPTSELAKNVALELEAYFAGELTEFTIPVRAKPGFSTRFSQALMDIPLGETKTYGDLAKILGVSAQAIGQACGANPVPIIVPCHRVLAANSLGGFSGAGGIEAKVALLKLEGAAGLLL